MFHTNTETSHIDAKSHRLFVLNSHQQHNLRKVIQTLTGDILAIEYIIESTIHFFTMAKTFYVCPTCTLIFKRKWTLNRHKKLHSPKIKRFLCPCNDNETGEQCETTCSTKWNMTVHCKKVHGKEFDTELVVFRTKMISSKCKLAKIFRIDRHCIALHLFFDWFCQFHSVQINALLAMDGKKMAQKIFQRMGPKMDWKMKFLTKNSINQAVHWSLMSTNRINWINNFPFRNVLAFAN